jgi:predicted negative regulator of RcsB-dependent stress response
MGIATKPLGSLPDDQASFADMLDRHKRNIGIVAAAILIAGAGAWFFVRSKAIKEQRADTQFQSAMQSVFSGNSQLAQSDLKKVVARYNGTTAGTEAALQLAQLYYKDSKFKEGIDVLKQVQPAEDLAYDVSSLLGVGYEGLNQGMQAAAAYEDAAKRARFSSDRDAARFNAARSYVLAGKTDMAVKILSDLVSDFKSVFAPQARVLLGEIQAKPVKV